LNVRLEFCGCASSKGREKRGEKATASAILPSLSLATTKERLVDYLNVQSVPCHRNRLENTVGREQMM